MNNEININENIVLKEYPNLIYAIKKRYPVNNSIIGYWIEIFSWQKAHLPFKKIYEKTGILCHHFSGVWHLGHFEAGKTIDSSLKALNITTFKKLPMQSPVIKIKIPTTMFKLTMSNFFHINLIL